MIIIVKGSFERDINKLRNREIKLALDSKMTQLINAQDPSQITGLKILRRYVNHSRIIVKANRHTYRIGAIARGNRIWLVRFLPRKTIYKKFP